MKLSIGLMPQQEYDQEDNLFIGDITLFANEFLSEDQYENDRDLILEMLPTWEIYNPRDIAYSMSRYDLLINDYLSGSNPNIQTLRSRLNLDVARLEGLSLDEYITLMFGVHSLVRAERNCIISKSKVAEGLRISGDTMATFFQARALSVDEFRNSIAGDGWSLEEFTSRINSHRFVTDTTEIRRHPFIRLDEDRYLALDILFAIELVTSGLYWTIFDGLPSNRREDFSSLWGSLFELYTVDLFKHFYPDPSGLSPFNADQTYNTGANNGQIDALLDYGNEVIIFEIKSSLLTLDAKCSRNWDLLETDLRRKFVVNERGQPKALRQLATATTVILRGELFTSRTPERVFPVLLVDEKAMECLGMNQYLNQIFRSLLDRTIESRVKPLTVMSIDELEELMPYVEQGAVTWQEVICSRFDGDRVNLFSVHQALYNILRDKGSQICRNGFLLRRFEEMFSRIRDLCIISDE